MSGHGEAQSLLDSAGLGAPEVKLRLQTKQFVVAFWQGVTMTSAASWIGVLAFAFFELVVCCVVFQPKLLAKMDRFYLMDSSHDEYADLSFRLITLHYAKLTEPHIAYFGPSQATRSLVAHDDDTLSEQLTKMLGSPVRFDVFSTNNQRIEDALQGVDQLPKSYHGAFVLQIHDGKDDYRGGAESIARNRRRLALSSTPSILPIWHAQGVDYPRTGIFFIDNFAFFAARRAAAMRFRPVEKAWGWGGRRDPQKLAEAEQKLEVLREKAENGQPTPLSRRRAPTFTKSRKVMLKLASVLRKRHLPLMLIESPRFPLRDEAAQDRIDQFHEDADRFCSETGAVFYDFNPELHLTDADFQDSAHLGSQSKRRLYTRLLMTRIVELLNADVEVVHTPAPAEPEPEPAEDEPQQDDDAGARSARQVN